MIRDSISLVTRLGGMQAPLPAIAARTIKSASLSNQNDDCSMPARPILLKTHLLSHLGSFRNFPAGDEKPYPGTVSTLCRSYFRIERC
jgi:hypothetical protein